MATNQFANDAFTPQANRSGMTAQQMSNVAQMQATTPQQTIAQSKSNPNQIIYGAITGATPGGQGIASVPTQFQAMTTPLASTSPASPSPVPTPTQGSSQMPSNAVSSYYDQRTGQWVQAPSGSAFVATGQGDYKTIPITKGGTGYTGNEYIDSKIGGASSATTTTPGTLSSATARQEAASQTATNNQTMQTGTDQFAQLTQQFADQQARMKAKSEADMTALQAKQKEESASNVAAAYKFGQTGTDYAKDFTAKLDAQHEYQQGSLRAEFSSYMAQSNEALARGQVALGKELAAQAKQATKDSLDLQKEYRDQKKFVDDVQKADVEKGGWIYSAAVSGYEPTEKELAAHDEIKGYNPGTSALLFFASKKLVQKDIGEAANAAAEALMKTDLGGVIPIAGYDYIVSGKANGVINSVEVDRSTGENMAISYDPKTRTTTRTPMGTFSAKWTIQDFGTKGVWRVDENSGEMVPLKPGPSQVTSNAAIPEGTTPPPRPGGNPANAGQCGSYWGLGTQITDMPDDFDSYKGKLRYLSTKQAVDISKIETGNTFLMGGYGDTGHIGFVGDLIHNPKTGVVIGFMANESNMVPPNGKTVSYSRPVYLNDTHITGFYDIPTPGFHTTGPDSQASSIASGVFVSGKATAEEKVLSFDELSKINATLPPSKQLQYGATSKDAARVGATPGTRITTPGVIDEKTTTELASMEPTKQEVWKNASLEDRDVARQLVNGDILLKEASTRAATGSPDSERIRLNKLALALDPNFSPAENERKNSYLKSWNDPDKTSHIARTKGNTTLGHLAELKHWTDQLQNTNFMKANSLKNAIAENINTPGLAEAVNNFNYAAEMVAHEMAGFYKGKASPTDTDIAEQRAIINNMKPKDILSSLINLQVNMMGEKVIATGDEYKKVMGKYPDDPIINPDVISSLKEVGIDTSRLEKLTAKQTNSQIVNVKGPDGKIYPYDLSKPELKKEYEEALKNGYTKQ